MENKLINPEFKYARKTLKKNFKRRFLWSKFCSFFKQLGIYFGILIALGFLFYNPISLAILCGTIVLIVLIIKLTK